MEKKVVVKTSSGEKSYKVVVSGSMHKCYFFRGGFFDTWTEIGRASGLEDALAVVKSHAGSFGAVRSVDLK